MEIQTKTRQSILFEVAWEVCNQVGGIYTVIRSKVPAMVEQWDENYCCLGPYFPQRAMTEFEPITSPENTPIGRTVEKMREMGLVVEYGHWLITGRPKIVLFDIRSIVPQLDRIKYDLWENHGISTVNIEDLVNQTICFS
ncbi:MAG: glycogen synthase, partial [Runella slithyformis]